LLFREGEIQQVEGLKERGGQIDSGDLHPAAYPLRPQPTWNPLNNSQSRATTTCNTLHGVHHALNLSMSVSYDAENAIGDPTWVALLLVGLNFTVLVRRVD
jgi:hypothetical protein